MMERHHRLATLLATGNICFSEDQSGCGEGPRRCSQHKMGYFKRYERCVFPEELIETSAKGHVCDAGESSEDRDPRQRPHDLTLLTAPHACVLADDFFCERSNPPTTSKVAYFKRKYAEEEDLHRGFHGYFEQHLILPEDRHCILKLSLEKLRFLEDPEAYLRRAVLINNLLRKIHHEEGDAGEEGPGPCARESSQRERYPDAKRLKVVVTDCCSQTFSYQEIQHLHVVPYAPASCLYGLGSHHNASPNHSSRVLVCKLDDNG
ncbi:SERTA domain-containing protein 4-like [Arapaima gigas]